MDLLLCNQIAGEIGNVDTSMCAFQDLETCFKECKSDIIVHDTDEGDSCSNLLQGCGYIIDLRRDVLDNEWDKIMKLFETEILTKTANLCSVHPNCSNELRIFHGEVADRQTRRSLVEVLDKYPLNSYYSLKDSSDGSNFDFDLSGDARSVMLKDLEAVKVVVEAAEAVSEKSFELIHLLTSVKTVLLMRHLLTGTTKWGISSYTSDVQSMDDLSDAVYQQAKLVSDHGEAVLFENMSRDIASIVANDNSAINYSSIDCENMSVSTVMSLVDTISIEAILCYFYNCVGIVPEVSVDVKLVHRLFLNRKAWFYYLPCTLVALVVMSMTFLCMMSTRSSY